MRPSKMKRALIRTAIKKGIQDIRTDPKRGMRNLVELGEMFASGRFQREFFGIALQQMRDEGSAYFRIVSQLVQQTNEEALTGFGINLGYNALSYGASAIRDIEATEGFNVPWCLSIDLGHGQHFLSPEAMQRVIEEGKDLGIYCYIIYFDEAYPHQEGFMQVLCAEKDCAFVLLCGCDVVKDGMCDMLEQARNVAVLLDIDTSSDEQLGKTVSRLREAGNLHGGFGWASKLEAKDISAQILERAERLGLSIMAFARIKTHRPLQADDVYERFAQLRMNLSIPVLPMDLYDDIAFADQAISSEACLAGVLGDGTLVLSNVERNTRTEQFNIHNLSLREALRCAMPKGTTGGDTAQSTA